MIREIEAKVLLAHVRQPDSWFGLRYNMNLYRGCQHQCIYCDSRSLCYGIENFRDVLVKTNAIPLLRRELASKRVKGTIGTGSMHDPYMPVEKHLNLTGQALAVIAEAGFPVHVITKSDLVLRDIDTLCAINRARAVVSFSVTTADDALARKLEPGASSSSARFRALATLAVRGIPTGVLLMPVLPFITDHADNITAIVEMAADHGASYIIPAFSMTLRDRQRAYYYDQLDRLFPGLSERYRRRYGDSYSCPANRADELRDVFYSACEQHGIQTEIVRYAPEAPANQLSLF